MSSLCAALTWVIVGFGLSLASWASAQTAADVLRPVAVQEIAQTQPVVTRQFFGRIVARQTVDLAFQVPGQIVELPATEGVLISSGTALARLDEEPFALALRLAEVELLEAERVYARQESLRSSNIASQANLDQAQTVRDLAEVTVLDARRSLENTILLAPFDGILAERIASNFNTVSAGQTVLRLHDMSEIRVEIEVPETVFRRVGTGVDIDVTASFPGETERFALDLREFNAVPNAVGQTFTLTLAMDIAPQARLLPGTTVLVRAEFSSPGSQIELPPSALRFSPAGDPELAIFNPLPDDPEIGLISFVAVEIASTREGRLVMVQGPPHGTLVLRAGAVLVEEGQRVRRFNGMNGG